jgi:hypothetical protein
MVRIIALVIVAAACGAAANALVRADGGQLPQARRPEELRYRLIGDEPIAKADLRGVVPGWHAVMVRDQHTGQCYVGFATSASVTLAGPQTCSE